MKLLPYLPLLILLFVPGTVHAAMEAEHLETHAEFVARKGYPESMEQWSDRHLLKAVDARVLHVVIYLGSQRGRLYANEQVVMDFTYDFLKKAIELGSSYPRRNFYRTGEGQGPLFGPVRFGDAVFHETHPRRNRPACGARFPDAPVSRLHPHDAGVLGFSI